MTGDAELLRLYVDEGSEPAFTELVQRHSGVVHAAAVRQTGDLHTARDVVQVVFTSLARQAGSLRGRPVILNWLYTAVHHTAAKARRTERRRQAREQEAFLMREDTPGDVSWEKMRPVLDAAMHELNRPDREALLLRYFQGMSYGEIGGTLEVSEDGARKRVDRALDRLRDSLVRRGIASTAGALATTLSARTAHEAGALTGGEIAGNALAAAKVGPAVASGATIFNLILGCAGLAVGAFTFHQGSAISLLADDISRARVRVEQVEAVEARASAGMRDVGRQVAALRSAAAPSSTDATALSPAAPQWPDNPAVEVVELLMGALKAGASLTIEYRTGPVSPSALRTLPGAGDFERAHFEVPGSASWPSLVRAAREFAAATGTLQEYLEAHAVLRAAIESLEQNALLLEKDTGADPLITATLRSNYTRSVGGILEIAGAISARPSERPEAVALTRQIAALAEVLSRHAPQSSPAP